MPPYANGHHMTMPQALNGGTSPFVPSGAAASAGAGGHHAVAGNGGGSSSSRSSVPPAAVVAPSDEFGIREVWDSNLHEEFRRIREVVQEYPFIAMDTEFPGVVARPVGTFITTADYQYNVMQVNTQMLKIIQLGLTFMNDEGKTPVPIATWQFNFKFNLTEDMYAQESIELLNKSGIQFPKHEKDGINSYEFAVLLIGSGVVLTEQVRWLSFHSGYDFGYLLRLLTDEPLPKRKAEFFELLKLYFPNLYDLKYLMKSTKDLKGGLQEVADMLGVDRRGPQHQAGSDSLLTGDLFFKMREVYFENNLESKHCGVIYGLEFDLPLIHAKAAGVGANGNGNNGSKNNGNDEEGAGATANTGSDAGAYGHVMVGNVRNANTAGSAANSTNNQAEGNADKTATDATKETTGK